MLPQITNKRAPDSLAPSEGASPSTKRAPNRPHAMTRLERTMLIHELIFGREATDYVRESRRRELENAMLNRDRAKENAKHWMRFQQEANNKRPPAPQRRLAHLSPPKLQNSDLADEGPNGPSLAHLRALEEEDEKERKEEERRRNAPVYDAPPPPAKGLLLPPIGPKKNERKTLQELVGAKNKDGRSPPRSDKRKSKKKATTNSAMSHDDQSPHIALPDTVVLPPLLQAQQEQSVREAQENRARAQRREKRERERRTIATRILQRWFRRFLRARSVAASLLAQWVLREAVRQHAHAEWSIDCAKRYRALRAETEAGEGAHRRRIEAEYFEILQKHLEAYEGVCRISGIVDEEGDACALLQQQEFAQRPHDLFVATEERARSTLEQQLVELHLFGIAHAASHFLLARDEDDAFEDLFDLACEEAEIFTRLGVLADDEATTRNDIDHDEGLIRTELMERSGSSRDEAKAAEIDRTNKEEDARRARIAEERVALQAIEIDEAAIRADSVANEDQMWQKSLSAFLHEAASISHRDHLSALETEESTARQTLQNEAENAAANRLPSLLAELKALARSFADQVLSLVDEEVSMRSVTEAEEERTRQQTEFQRKQMVDAASVFESTCLVIQQDEDSSRQRLLLDENTDRQSLVISAAQGLETISFVTNERAARESILFGEEAMAFERLMSAELNEREAVSRGDQCFRAIVLLNNEEADARSIVISAADDQWRSQVTEPFSTQRDALAVTSLLNKESQARGALEQQFAEERSEFAAFAENLRATALTVFFAAQRQLFCDDESEDRHYLQLEEESDWRTACDWFESELVQIQQLSAEALRQSNSNTPSTTLVDYGETPPSTAQSESSPRGPAPAAGENRQSHIQRIAKAIIQRVYSAGENGITRQQLYRYYSEKCGIKEVEALRAELKLVQAVLLKLLEAKKVRETAAQEGQPALLFYVDPKQK